MAPPWADEPWRNRFGPCGRGGPPSRPHGEGRKGRAGGRSLGYVLPAAATAGSVLPGYPLPTCRLGLGLCQGHCPCARVRAGFDCSPIGEYCPRCGCTVHGAGQQCGRRALQMSSRPQWNDLIASTSFLLGLMSFANVLGGRAAPCTHSCSSSLLFAVQSLAAASNYTECWCSSTTPSHPCGAHGRRG